ncbi:hypothetical protein DDB_G0279357 [Dictyostelium discoideum AX4]|uniref:Putative isoaspartyl peptidase/L-asparaginase n=1 Tax=Dictyostelium discoideum TaxID=44689 RepID=ASGX_DICDI|nr:hypothetical protein DDB_G0279357 [Dictyostelium discoideum AX4]Q54WW4.1 RecName: Full=Putative isoaspartyl peptidase/L-asparaginase; AltName: Full=Beta-aspartyl-peptidase; AltName: Full=Isoaspartyl dipeptidase; AltName: Full=L-asparagine amidohydrolase; Contains: RecName: Full=Putative isoaspartyl peptidase/L-asparaginase alpha chain; Contains: RecName: Full=Putative isoaspartyl peptidase/L-asparaginase beta chain; Flags: Precursor [Dictyostelium discoideum]EAL67827.1 hypothetical protein DDB|eukprot:XP_641813.1 hypothetical protein DDB_G0279357 [Dictyostelium discoideum AX4]
MNKKSVLVIHGGAGVISKSTISKEREEIFLNSLKNILLAGKIILKQGGTSLDVVQEAVRLLEEDPIYNAGKGSVFTELGTNEMDAAIMDGTNLKAGAVGGVSIIRNPIIAARAVMEHTNHCLLVGKGAEEFAKSKNLEIVEPSFFFTQNRYDQLLRAKDEKKLILDHDGENLLEKEKEKEKNNETSTTTTTISVGVDPIDPKYKMGTVGAVCLDSFGNLAAATSTGGMTNKMHGRVGDTPIIGAGVYANKNVAVSSTGTGEAFMRTVAAFDIAAMMEYGSLSLKDASNKVVMEKLITVGDGGVICVDKYGNVEMPFNTEGMYRGYVIIDNNCENDQNDIINVSIYK